MKHVFALFVLLLFPTQIFAAPAIGNFADTGSVGLYEKFEVTASGVTTVSNNYFLPYETVVVPGLTAGKGVSFDGIFLPPSANGDWAKAYKQPGFYYVDYLENGTYYLPTGNNSWKVRFAPNEIGAWQYKLGLQDASGSFQSAVKSFNVVSSANHGFIRVSKNDPRYFEFSDGTYFPGMAVNKGLDKNDPIGGNVAFLDTLKNSGVQVLRFWLSNWTIFGSSWTPWESVRGDHDYYLPRTGLIVNQAESTTTKPASVLTLTYADDGGTNENTYWFDACRLTVSEGGQVNFATEQGETYHIKIRYQAKGISGPRDSRFPNYGFVLKRQSPTDGVWYGPSPDNLNKRYCWNGSANQRDTGIPLTNYGQNTLGWVTPDGTNWNSPNWSYIEGDWVADGSATPLLYLALENVNNMTAQIEGQTYNWHPYVYVDSVEIRKKNLSDGSLGPNIVSRWSMSYLEHIDERNAYAFDKALELAKSKGVYLKTVIMEKDEQIENEIGYDGKKADFNNDNLFGNWRNMTAVRWYQQAWWRYLQARWGYSTAIHSWELVNEGKAPNGNHYSLTDELGKYMHCKAFGITVAFGDSQKCSYEHPNSHMVTTSFPSGFYRPDFWDNRVLPPNPPDPNLTYGFYYPNVDYADVHDYINKPSEPTNYYDTALATYSLGMAYGALQPGGANKPVMRGETGLITDGGTDAISDEMDSKGVWLHNFVWGQINSYGLIEAWWHIVQIGNLWPIYKDYYDFIYNVPLNKGGYVDAAATVTGANVRAWGQKNLSKGLAHIWVSNSNNTWNNIKAGQITNLNGTVTITGFLPNQSYPVEWWKFDSNVVLAKSTGQVIADNTGKITLNLPSNTIDAGIKIGNYNATTHIVDITEYRTAIKSFSSVFYLANIITNYGQ